MTPHSNIAMQSQPSQARRAFQVLDPAGPVLLYRKAGDRQ